MQITKAMELVAFLQDAPCQGAGRAEPPICNAYKTLTEIAASRTPSARNPYLRRSEIKRTLLVVIAGDRGLAGGYNTRWCAPSGKAPSWANAGIECEIIACG